MPLQVEGNKERWKAKGGTRFRKTHWRYRGRKEKNKEKKGKRFKKIYCGGRWREEVKDGEGEEGRGLREGYWLCKWRER